MDAQVVTLMGLPSAGLDATSWIWAPLVGTLLVLVVTTIGFCRMYFRQKGVVAETNSHKDVSFPNHKEEKLSEAKDVSAMCTTLLGKDVDGPVESLEVFLERVPGEAWGFAWHVRAYAAQRFLVAGIDPNSPAGRWVQQCQAQGLAAIGRGDELFSANGSSSHGIIRRELVVADKLCLQFLRANSVPAVGNSQTARDIVSRQPLSPQKALVVHPLMQTEQTSKLQPDLAEDEHGDLEDGWGPDVPEPQVSECEVECGATLSDKIQKRLDEQLKQKLQERGGGTYNLEGLPVNFWSYQYQKKVKDSGRSVTQAPPRKPSDGAIDLLGGGQLRKSAQAGVRSRSDPPPAAPQVLRSGSDSPCQSGCDACIDASPAGVNPLENTSGSSSPGDWDSAQSYLKQVSNQIGRHQDGSELAGDKDSHIFSSGGSGSGSGSENATSDKCPSTDWEYMMDNRPGSCVPGSLSANGGFRESMPEREESRASVVCRDVVPSAPSSMPPAMDGHASTGNPSNLVIIAASQDLALQTANALGTVLASGVLPARTGDGRAQQWPLEQQHPASGPLMAGAPVPAPLLPPQCLGDVRTPPPPQNAPRAFAIPDHSQGAPAAPSTHSLVQRLHPAMSRTGYHPDESSFCAGPPVMHTSATGADGQAGCMYPIHAVQQMQLAAAHPRAQPQMAWSSRQASHCAPQAWPQQAHLGPQHLPIGLEAGKSIPGQSALHRFFASGGSAVQESVGASFGHASSSVTPLIANAAAVPAASVRADSAPPVCGLPVAAVSSVASEARPRKKTYRAGVRVTAKRARAAKRASERDERDKADAPDLGDARQTEGRDIIMRDFTATRAARTCGPSAVSSGSGTVRSDSAPPALERKANVGQEQGSGNSAQAGNSAGRLYYKPRRRAGQKVRQRMEYAIARRKEQAAIELASGTCSNELRVQGDAADRSEGVTENIVDSTAQTVGESVQSSSASCAAAHVDPVGTASMSRGGAEGAAKPRRSFYPSKASNQASSVSNEAASDVTLPRGTELATADVVPAEKKSKRLRQRSRGEGEKQRLRTQKSSAQRPQLAAPSAMPQSAAECNAPRAAVDEGADDIIGQRVLINGLLNSPQFNGQWGQVDGYDSEMQRYLVRVFLGAPGTPPVLAKLRRESLVVPRGSPPQEEELLAAAPCDSLRSAWQPSLRL